MKYSTQEDMWNIRVDSPTDVIFVDEMDDVLKNTPWRNQFTDQFEDMKKKGDSAFTSMNYNEALKYYNRAIKIKHDPSINLNKAATLFQLERISEAYNAAKKAHENGANQQKTLYWLANAAYRMSRWNVAEEHFTKLVKMHPDNTEFAEELARCQHRLQEFRHGKYNFVKLYTDTIKNKHQRMDIADYIGPIKVGEIGPMKSNGKSKGILATENIKKGTLLIGSKAFSYVDEDLERDKLTVVTANLIANRVEGHAHSMNIIQTCLKLKDNPDKSEQLYALYAGEDEDRRKAIPEGIVDAARVAKICSFNAFGIGGTFDRRTGCEAKPYVFTGLWIMPSFINHSCLPNAIYRYYGDFMAITALKDIKAGEEITIAYAPTEFSFEERNVICNSFNFTCLCGLCRIDRVEKAAIHQKRKIITDEIMAIGDSVDADVIKKKVDVLRDTFRIRKKFKFQLLWPLVRLANEYSRGTSDDSFNEGIATCKEIVEIIGEHGISILTKIYVLLFELYHSLGQSEEAKKSLKNAVESFNRFRGINDGGHIVFKMHHEQELQRFNLELYLEAL